MKNFDELADTPAAREALELLRTVSGTSGGPMELHCLRCRHLAAEIATRQGWTIDEELLTVASIMHDIGLYPGASSGGVYTADGAARAREVLLRHGWPAERAKRCARAIDGHHDLRSQLPAGPEAEALRLADRVELSGGLLAAGIDRPWLRELWAAIPRRGLAGELARQVGRALRERPLTMPRIFWRGPLS
jgi:HD superfamily phosphodiesterase